MKSSILSAIDGLTQQLSTIHDPHTARNYSWWILEAVTNQHKSYLLAHTYHLTRQEEAHSEQICDEHINQHKPLAYCIGWVPFGDMHINIRPPILIPRPETEEWCMHVCEQLHSTHKHTLQILDLCTGSGAIALALAKAVPDAQLTAIDILPDAVALAKENAAINKIINCNVLLSDLFSTVAGKQFDIIVANPPYVAPAEWDGLDLSVRLWEDKQSIVAPDDGFELIRRIIQQAPAYLTPARLNMPNLYMEVGYTQAPAVQQIMHAAGYTQIQMWEDMQGHLRVVSGTWKS